jgi:Protein of unknown function (DUF2971)
MERSVNGVNSRGATSFETMNDASGTNGYRKARYIGTSASPAHSARSLRPEEGRMTLPPLYKYLDVRGAKLTLGNRTFRHGKPSDFNDIEGMTIQSIFAEETEVALNRLSEGFQDVLLAHLNDPPTCGAPMRQKVEVLQQLYRANPKAVGLVQAEMMKDGAKPLFDVEQIRARAKAHIADINAFLQDWRVFCVTINKNSERMWSEYAEKHKGIMLRIEPNIKKDSKFQRFEPVIYHTKRPPLYDDTMQYIAESLFGDQEARIHSIMKKIIYAKTLKWQHECEYRLAIPLADDEEPYETLPYHPEEITELYLGLAMDAKDRNEIVTKAQAVNESIVIFQAKRDAEDAIAFDLI